MCYTASSFVIKYFSLCNACKLTELNLGNNTLKELPAVLRHLESLKKLFLFSNQITVVPPEVIGRLSLFCMISILKDWGWVGSNLTLFCNLCFTGGLQNLVVLNLNHNQIQRLPPEIKRYVAAECARSNVAGLCM